MIKKYLAIVFVFLGLSACMAFRPHTADQQSNELFTIYLVRHSEKALSSQTPADPPLTDCGAQRSEHLSTFLQDVPLEAVYSTNYIRTLSTARPTATAKQLNIEQYSPGDLQALSALLLERKQDALVVGHSNTTAVLAGMLVGEELGEFDLSIYNRIYQVVISKDAARLHLLHTAFECPEE